MNLTEIKKNESQKKAEAALKDAYSLLQGVIDSPIGVVIFALDCQYRYIAFNRNHFETMKQIWGVEIALGSSMLEYVNSPEDRQKAKANFDRALSGESFTLEEEYGNTALSRRYYEDKYNPIFNEDGGTIGLTLFLTDITDRKQMEAEKNRLSLELETAQARIKVLSGLLPICSSCKKIRNDDGEWEQIEGFIRKHSEADFTHSLCPTCMSKLYPDFF